MAKRVYPPSVLEWTHVSDALPENREELLVILSGRVQVAFVWSGVFLDTKNRKIKPTHWAYIPTV